MKILYILFISFVVVTSSPAFSQEQPVIAPEVGRLLAEEGVDAAKARFNELDQLKLALDRLDARIQRLTSKVGQTP